MTMPKQLIEVREKLAMDACIVPDNEGEPVQDQWAHDRFCAGFNACFETLALDVEFDATAACDEFEERWENVDRANDACEGARWQFDQMKARVGLALSSGYAAELERKLLTESKAHSDECDMHSETNRLLVDKIKRLEHLLMVSQQGVGRNPSDSEIAGPRE